jgi:hypothetical protein
MQVAPGTAQDIPQALSWVILVLAICTIFLVSAWGRIFPWFIGLFRKK